MEKQTKNIQSKKQNEQKPRKPAIEKFFKDFFRNNQDLPKKRTPNTYVSPHKSNYRDHSHAPFRKHFSGQNSSSHDKYDCQNKNSMHYTNTRSPTPNRYYN